MTNSEAILKIAGGHDAGLPMLAEILSDETIDEELFDAANSVKMQSFGSEVFVRAIIEFSNYCVKSCSYCGINAGCGIERYRIEPDELVRIGIETGKIYKTVILQSGEDPYYTAEMLAGIVRGIKLETEAAVTLSVGERSLDEYRIMREAGADRFLIKHETSDEGLYRQLHGQGLLSRLDCQRHIKELGFELGGGFMVGLPGQTNETLAGDLLLLKKMQVDMAGIGPYICHPDTALLGCVDGDAQKTLKVLALARLLLPNCHLPSTTALNVKGGMKDALFCGADVIMQKATPIKYRRLYDIYPGRDAEDIPLGEQYEKLKRTLLGFGLHAK